MGKNHILYMIRKQKFLISNYSYNIPKLSKKSYAGFDKFMKNNPDNLIVFRPGAVFTNDFGLTERYKVMNGKIVWGYPGIHKGVDRGKSKVKRDNKVNGIWCPFNFGRSGFKDWGGRAWGSDIYLYHKIGFRLRISHMQPKKIKLKNYFDSCFPVNRGTYIGPIGSYGFSTAAHSHVEIEAWGFHNEWLTNCEILDILLDELYGKVVKRPLTFEEVRGIYRKCSKTIYFSDKQICEDYKKLLESKRIVFLNKFRMVIKERSGKYSTLYSTKGLFNM